MFGRVRRSPAKPVQRTMARMRKVSLSLDVYCMIEAETLSKDSIASAQRGQVQAYKDDYGSF